MGVKIKSDISRQRQTNKHGAQEGSFGVLASRRLRVVGPLEAKEFRALCCACTNKCSCLLFWSRNLLRQFKDLGKTSSALKKGIEKKNQLTFLFYLKNSRKTRGQDLPCLDLPEIIERAKYAGTHGWCSMRDREPKIARWKNLYWSPVSFPAEACWPDKPTGDTVVPAHHDHMSFDWRAASPPRTRFHQATIRESFSTARYSWSRLTPATCKQRSEK